jgi:hypothetical protein
MPRAKRLPGLIQAGRVALDLPEGGADPGPGQGGGAVRVAETYRGSPQSLDQGVLAVPFGQGGDTQHGQGGDGDAGLAWPEHFVGEVIAHDIVSKAELGRVVPGVGGPAEAREDVGQVCPAWVLPGALYPRIRFVEFPNRALGGHGFWARPWAVGPRRGGGPGPEREAEGEEQQAGTRHGVWNFA